MPGVGPRDTEIVLERLRRAVGGTPIALQGQEIIVTVSIGGAVCRGENIDELLTNADDSLYRAKDQGRDRVVMSRKVEEIEAEIAAAAAAALVVP